MVPRSVVLVVLAVVVAVSAAPAAQTKSSIEGVWKVAEVQVTGGEGSNAAPQPGLYIFTRGHYSIMTINSAKPRAVLAQGPATTDKDKIARFEHWNEFTANSGTYTVKGTTLTIRPIVAKNEGVMQGAPQTREFKIEGATLWLVQKGGPGAPNTETRTKLTRVE